MSVSPAPALLLRTAPRLKSTSTAVFVRPSAHLPSTSVSGATCIRAGPATTAPPPTLRAFHSATNAQTNFLFNGNVIKKNLNFFEAYAKVNYTINDMFTIGATEYYSPNFLNTGAWGNYASITGKFTAPSSTFGSSGLGMYISGEFGRQWLGTSDSFYGTGFTNPGFAGPFPNGIDYADYNTWNIGVGFTYKVFTLDIRYSDTDLSKGDCNAFTSDFAARGNINAFTGTSVTAINPTGVGSNWCGATGIVKLSADLTAMTSLK